VIMKNMTKIINVILIGFVFSVLQNVSLHSEENINSIDKNDMFLDHESLLKLEKFPDEILTKIKIDSMKNEKYETDDFKPDSYKLEDLYVYAYRRNHIISTMKNMRTEESAEYYESGNIKKYSIFIVRVNEGKKRYEEKIKTYSISYIDDNNHQISRRFFSINVRGTQSYYVEEYEDGKIVKTVYYSRDMTVENMIKDGKIEKVEIVGFSIDNPIDSFREK